jgi:hypothetical protein
MTGMALKTTPRSFLWRLSEEQRTELGQLADTAGVPIQEYLELQVFGRVRPRLDQRSKRAGRDQPQLPIEGTEEASTRKSA